MNRCKIKPWQFLMVAGAGLTVVLALSVIAELRREQSQTAQVIGDLAAKYQEEQYLTEQLAGQLKEFKNKMNELQRRTAALEELLLHRARSYLSVAGEVDAVRAQSALLPSRAGLREVSASSGVVHLNVKSKSGFTPQDFEHVWLVYGADNLAGLGEVLVKAEKTYGINALVLAAIIVHESQWGRSIIARQKNNLAGLGAYDQSPMSSALTFKTKEDCVIFLAELLAGEYVAPGGRHFNGTDLNAIGKSYASDPHWAYKVAATMRLLVLAAVENPGDVLDFAAQISLKN